MRNAPDFYEIPPVARSFILLCVALAYAAWDIGFELGAHGRIFFEKLFMVWAISTALLISLLILPNKKRKVPYVAFAVTAFPSVWLILAMLARTSPDSADLRLSASAKATGQSLPYRNSPVPLPETRNTARRSDAMLDLGRLFAICNLLQGCLRTGPPDGRRLATGDRKPPM